MIMGNLSQCMEMWHRRPETRMWTYQPALPSIYFRGILISTCTRWKSRHWWMCFATKWTFLEFSNGHIIVSGPEVLTYYIPSSRGLSSHYGVALFVFFFFSLHVLLLAEKTQILKCCLAKFRSWLWLPFLWSESIDKSVEKWSPIPWMTALA